MSFFKQAKKYAGKGVAVAVASVSSVAVQAADFTTEIGAASTEASGNQTAVITAVIGIAVIGFGVGAVVSWMKSR